MVYHIQSVPMAIRCPSWTFLAVRGERVIRFDSEGHAWPHQLRELIGYGIIDQSRVMPGPHGMSFLNEFINVILHRNLQAENQEMILVDFEYL